MEQQKTGNESDKEALLKFMQDAECLDALSKWTNDFNIFDVLRCRMSRCFIKVDK